jgi:D-alanyl-D-alanine carboxypeptidase
MFKLLLSATLLFSPIGFAYVKQEDAQCSRSQNYQGAALHSGVDIQTLPSEFDVSGELDFELAVRLNEAVDWALENTDAPGITAAVGIPKRGLWTTTVGLLSTEPSIPVGDDSVFWWASAGKLFTSSAILQLVSEGKLTLDRTIDTWFPTYPQSQSITIENLLTHTGGVFSFQQDLKLRRQTDYKTPDELINISARHGANFCPGEYWHYSNTGYVMLAKIIEDIEAKPFSEVVKRRIIDPLGLTQTKALSPEELPATLAIGHVDGKPEANYRPSLTFGAGNIISSSRDMVVFLAALLSGEVYSKSLLEYSLQPLYPMFGNGTYYGQGIMLYEVRQESDSVNWVGHGGGSSSVKTIVAYDLDSNIFVAVAMNADEPAEALAYQLIEVAKQYQKQANGD